MKIMTKNKFIHAVLFMTLVFGTWGCNKDALQIGNPNAPTVQNDVINETGLVSYAQGGVYVNGFANGDGWLGNSYFSLPWGYSELLADNVGADASNNQITTIAQPTYYIKSDGTNVPNTSSTSIGIIKAYNTRAATGNSNNALYYQWLNMYALNNAMNEVLAVIDNIKFTGDQASKANTFKAWCYWWKGYAYQSIGLMYYSGLIIDAALTKSNVYVSHDDVIARSTFYFNLAATTLAAVTVQGDYAEVLGQLIPSYCQVGHGGVLTPEMWTRNINTMLARNILLNRLSPYVNGSSSAVITGSTTATMAAADWANVKTLTAAGIQNGDFIFTGRTFGSNDFFTATGGSVAALTSSINTTSTFKISERFIQFFRNGDKRFTNNFKTGKTYNNNYTYTTRYSIIDGGGGASGVYVYGSTSVGGYELVIAGSYEENQLMAAEAAIRTGDSETGLGLIDQVRTYLGAGIPAVKGTGLTVDQAFGELVSERRVALVFRGLSYYDNRRYGWIYDIAKNGGGSYGNIIVNSDGSIFNGVTINYNFMDYWDIPADESQLNPPDKSGLGTTNPNYD
jgi:hypothetical protein